GPEVDGPGAYRRERGDGHALPRGRHGDRLGEARPRRPQPGRLTTIQPQDLKAMPTPLTAHFALEELACTQHREFDNTPPPEAVATLRLTAARMEDVRRRLGERVISVSSGYRCRALNRAVGGASTSAHLSGHAVDFNCYGFGAPLDVCRA